MPEQNMAEVSEPDAISGIRNFGDVLGMRRVEVAAGEASFEIPLSSEHLNRHGSVHGGVIMALLDTAGLWSICDTSEDVSAPKAMTVSLNCCFVGQSKSDDKVIRATGRISKKGNRLYFSTVVAESHPSGRIVATGQGVYSKSS